MREKAKLPQRTIRIIRVHRDGPVADAKIRVDNFDTTVKLPEVLSGPSTVTAVEPDKARWRAR
jgi:hypothetical protein